MHDTPYEAQLRRIDFFFAYGPLKEPYAKWRSIFTGATSYGLSATYRGPHMGAMHDGAPLGWQLAVARVEELDEGYIEIMVAY